MLLSPIVFLQSQGLDPLRVRPAYGYGAGESWNANSVHQWIIEKAVQYALQKEGGKARLYQDLLTWDSWHFLDFLKSGVWRADNSTLRCSWYSWLLVDEAHDCDSLHHYGNYGVIETNDGADAANPGHLIAPVYADGLYELAVKFWPGGEAPSLESLRYLDAGQIMMTGLDITPTDLMNTYVGGLPHCERHFYDIYYSQYFERYCNDCGLSCPLALPYIQYQAHRDAYRDAKNKCPVWPPGIALDSDGKQTMESIEFALEYLGWALHMIQDLTIPYHALNQATSGHSSWENSITELWREGAFDDLPLEGYHSCYNPDNVDLNDFAKAVPTDYLAQVIRNVTIDCKNQLGYTNELKRILLDLAIKVSAALIEKFFDDVTPFQDDQFEDNDAWYQVKMISPGSYSGLTVFPGDEDWYRFHVPSDHSDIVIDVVYDAPLQDDWPWLSPWLVVHRPTGDDVVGGQRTAYGKRIELRDANAGYYELRIESRIPIRYYLGLSVTEGALPEDEFEVYGGNDTPETASTISDLMYYPAACYEGLNIDRPGDDDFYSFPLPEGNWRVTASIKFPPAQGQLRLFVNEEEAKLGVLLPDGRRSVSLSQCVRVSSVWPPPVLLRVTGARNYYELCIEKSEDPTCGDVPRASVSPSAFLFGTYTVGTSSPFKIVTISNQGSSDLHIEALNLSDQVNFELSLDEGSNPCGGLPSTVPPGGSCTAGVRFKPQSASKFKERLTVVTDDPISPSTLVSLQGAGAQIRISSTPPWLYKCNGEQQFTISGGAAPYSIEWGMCLPSTTPWGAPGPVLCSYDFPLPYNFEVQQAGDTVSLKVNGCVPDYVLNLWIKVTDSRGIYGTKDIEIIIPEPDISVSTGRVDFGDVTVGPFDNGWPTAIKTISVLNTGTGPLGINATLTPAANPGDISIRNNCPGEIEPYGTCTIEALYRPTLEGEARALVTLTSNDPDQGEVSVELVGNGVRRPRINNMVLGEPLDVAVGGSGSVRVNIWNTGSGVLEINSISLSGSSDFSITQNTCTHALPYPPPVEGTCYVTVAFNPSSLGPKSATLTVESNDPRSSSITVPLAGTGVSPFMSTSSTSLDFEQAGKRLCFSIRNTSSSSALSWTLGGDMPSWLAASLTSGSLDPGRTETLCLYADRSGLDVGQSYAHTVTITSNGGTATIPVSVTVPTPMATFAKYFGGEGGDYFYQIRGTSDGGFIAAGMTNSFGSGPEVAAGDGWVVKTDGSGYVEWARSYGTYWYWERAYDVRETSDGGFILVAGTNGFTSEGQYGLWIFKLNAYGDIEWQKVYETPQGSEQDMDGLGMKFSVQEVDDGYVVAGNVWNGSLDLWLLKLDKTGEIQWQRTYGGTDNDFANALWATSDEGYVLAGATRVSTDDGGPELPVEGPPSRGDETPGGMVPVQGHWDVWVLKLQGNGDIQWEKRYGTPYDDYASDIQQTSEGGFILIGTTHSTMSAWVLKLDEAGNIQWQKSYGASDTQHNGAHGHSIKETKDGGYVFTGVLESPGSGEDMWLVKLDGLGNVQWERVYGGEGAEASYCVDEIPEGGYVIAGYSSSIWSEDADRQADAIFLRVDSKGNIGDCDMVGSANVEPVETHILPVETDSQIGESDAGAYDTLANVTPQEEEEGFSGYICSAYTYMLIVSKAGTGTGQVISEPAGISCGQDCDEPFSPNTSVVVTAIPLAGSTFAGWTGDCSGLGANQASVTMDSDKECTAIFQELTGADITGTWGRVRFHRSREGYSLIRGSLQVSNVGNESTSHGFWVSFYLSDDEVFDQFDLLVNQTFVRKLIKPGRKVRIPFVYWSKNYLDKQYVIAVMDSLDQQTETDETNNIATYGPLFPIRFLTPHFRR